MSTRMLEYSHTYYFGNHKEASANFAVPSSMEEGIAYKWGNRSSTGHKYLDFPGSQHMTNKFLLLISYQPTAFCYRGGTRLQGLTGLEVLPRGPIWPLFSLVTLERETSALTLQKAEMSGLLAKREEHLMETWHSNGPQRLECYIISKFANGPTSSSSPLIHPKSC